MSVLRRNLFRLTAVGTILLPSILNARDVESGSREQVDSVKRVAAAGIEASDSTDETTVAALAKQADELERRYDWAVYSRHIAEAHRAWETGALEEAWRHLNACRADLRGWEHDYLFSLLTRDQMILKTQWTVESVAFSADGERLVSCYSRTVRTWRCKTGTELLTRDSNSAGQIDTVAFSPDGTRIALGADGKTQIIDAETGERLLTCPAGDHLCYSRDGKQILSNSHSKAPTLWDAATGKPIRTFDRLSNRLERLALSPDGRQIASGGSDKLLRIVDATTGEVRHTLKGHRDAIGCVTFSPNGSRVASGSSDKSIKVWDVGSGRELFTLKGHDGPINSIAFSTDGLKLVSGSDDALVKLWDVTTGRRELQSWKGHHGDVRSVAFSPDGKQVASGGDDQTIRLWEVAPLNDGVVRILERGQPEFGSRDEPKLSGMTTRIRVWNPVVGKVKAIEDASSGPVLRELSDSGAIYGFRRHAYAVSPDGKQIVVTGGESISGLHGGYLKLVDIASGQVIHTLSDGGGPFHHVVFSSDGKWVVGSAYNSFGLWESESGKQILSVGGMSRIAAERVAMINSLAISSDNKRVAAGTSEGTIHLFDVPAGRLLVTLTGHVKWVDSVAFNPNGSRLVTTGRDAIRIWEPTFGQELLTLRGKSEMQRQTVFSPDGRHLVSRTDEGQYRFWNAPSQQKVFTLADCGEPMALSPDGRQLACRGPDGGIQLIDRVSHRRILSLAGDSTECTCLAFSPDGKSIAGGGKDDVLDVWDAASGKLIHELKGHTHYVGCVAFSLDNRRIVSGSGDHSIRIWDAKSGEAIRTIEHWASCVAFSLDGKRIAGSNRDAPIRIWNAETGEEVRKIDGKKEGYECFAFSPDGGRIASGGHDGIVRLWDVETGRELLQMKGHSSFIYGLAFSTDGKWIASASWDHTAKVWDASTGKEHRSLRQHSSYCSSVAFTPDSRWLVSGSRELKLWDLSGTRAELTD